jgi:hypothetical protein
MVRSVLAVVVGFIVVLVASLGTDIVVMLLLPRSVTEAQPPGTGLLLGILGYCFVYMVLGGYVTAFIAGRCPVRHALVLGGIGLTVGAAMTLAARLGGSGHAPAMPTWYTVVTLGYVLPATALGGVLRYLQRRAYARPAKQLA